MKFQITLPILALASIFSSCAPAPVTYVEEHNVTVQERPKYTKPKPVYRPAVKRDAPEDFRAVETPN
ncbi:MAG: hypothetical protein HC845_04995 [Akkermansiaceae bacterium]|nr:hypothetical protein [Akkermansiaceae bacterium]